MAMASEKVFFILQAQAKKMREKIHSRIFSLSFLPAFLFFFLAKDLKRNPVLVHVCKWEHVSVFQQLCECGIMCPGIFMAL